MNITNAYKLLMESFAYVSGQNMFWASMGLTAGIAVFVGSLIYDGRVDGAKKGAISILAYALMIILTTAARILPNAIERDFIYSDGRPFAAIATNIYITISWLFGMFIGVNIFKFKKFK